MTLLIRVGAQQLKITSFVTLFSTSFSYVSQAKFLYPDPDILHAFNIVVEWPQLAEKGNIIENCGTFSS